MTCERENIAKLTPLTLAPTPDAQLPSLPTLTGTGNHDAGGSGSSYDTVLPSTGMAGGGVLDGASGYAPGVTPGLVLSIPESQMNSRLSMRGNHSTPYGQLLGLGGDDYIIGNRDTPIYPIYIDGGDGSDWIVGSYFWASPETAAAAALGTSGSTLLGGTGHDAILGTWQDDWLDAGTGNDQAFGSLGRDTLIGGTVAGFRRRNLQSRHSGS